MRTGRLEKAAYDAQEKTTDALALLISQGMPYHMAWESVRENWIYLPDERTQPSLGRASKPPDGDLGTSDYWGID